MNNTRTWYSLTLISYSFLALALLCSFLSYCKDVLHLQEWQTKTIIEQIVSTHVTADGKALSRQLDRSFSFYTLQVSRLDNTILYEQKKPDEHSLMASLLKLVGKNSTALTLEDQQQDIKVLFILDQQNTLDALQGFIIFILLLPLCACLITLFFIRHYARQAGQHHNVITVLPVNQDEPAPSIPFDTNSNPASDTVILIEHTLSTQPDAWQAAQDTNEQTSIITSDSSQNWLSIINDIIDQQRLTLLTQVISAANTATLLYTELLVRFKTPQDAPLSTSTLLMMAEKLGKITTLDQLIVNKAMQSIKAKHSQHGQFGLNLSPNSVLDASFTSWLETELNTEPAISKQLVFEVSELSLQQNITASGRFIDMIHRAGAKVTVEQFGIGTGSFKLFRDLKPDFVKMDASYTRHIANDTNNQYFMRLMIDLAHRSGAKVLAAQVETAEEKAMLESLFIDGYQGNFFGEPEPLDSQV